MAKPFRTRERIKRSRVDARRLGGGLPVLRPARVDAPVGCLVPRGEDSSSAVK